MCREFFLAVCLFLALFCLGFGICLFSLEYIEIRYMLMCLAAYSRMCMGKVRLKESRMRQAGTPLTFPCTLLFVTPVEGEESKKKREVAEAAEAAF